MNREQMIEKAARILGQRMALRQSTYEMCVEILDAILPQVTTVEELDALPDKALIISDRGIPYLRTSARHYKWRHLLSGMDWDSLSLAEDGVALTVVSSPS